MFHNLRPGVYARHELFGGHTPSGSRTAALVLRREGKTPGCHSLSRFSDADSLVAGDALAGSCLRLLFEGGAGKVYLIHYKSGGQALSELPVLSGAVLCDEHVPGDVMAAYLERCATAQRDCLILTGRDTASAALTAAEAFSHQRLLVCGPAASLPDGTSSGLFGACCLAGELLTAEDPLHSFSGMAFPALAGAASLPEEEVQRLLAAGVCVFEEVGGTVRIIRATTTAEDSSLRGINALLITDRVMARVRGRLERRLRAGVTSPVSIGDQVTVELMSLEEEGLITGFDPPLCRQKEDDPTCCVVTLSFSVAHLVSRIHITAHIRA